MKAQRGSRGIALLFLDGGGWSAPHPHRFTPGKDPVPTVQEAGWATGPVWKGAENLAPTGNRSPDRPVRSEYLYRLSYSAPQLKNSVLLFITEAFLYLIRSLLTLVGDTAIWMSYLDSAMSKL